MCKSRKSWRCVWESEWLKTRMEQALTDQFRDAEDTGQVVEDPNAICEYYCWLWEFSCHSIHTDFTKNNLPDFSRELNSIIISGSYEFDASMFLRIWCSFDFGRNTSSRDNSLPDHNEYIQREIDYDIPTDSVMGYQWTLWRTSSRRII